MSEQLNSHLLNERLLLLVAVMIDVTSCVFHCSANGETKNKESVNGNRNERFQVKSEHATPGTKNGIYVCSKHMDQSNCGSAGICHFAEFLSNGWSLHMTRDAYRL